MKSTLRSIGACSKQVPTIKSENGSRAKGGTLEARQMEALGLAKCSDYCGNVAP
jgi:hypothetical protein